MFLVLAANPILATGGQLAGIIICFYILIFVMLALVFNLVMAFAMGWIREKIELLKKLRPMIESINESTEAVSQGVEPAAYENTAIRTVATIPARVNAADKKVDQAADRVADAVIEFRARTVQAQTIVKAFFLPGLTKRSASGKQREIAGPDQRLEEIRAAEIAAKAPTEPGTVQPASTQQP
ncbi:hypothetical protein EPA93_25560 [Ktedonosporobacter rubrisoli]|uniref:Uncharacterized protein n=1 Tax=Ktedonosporobacter rubrisoli TaxID=2509675 RepID=A0A4P6JV11_KTERU|nr:hypothetical protein [Ktedonosporobacter rubrisoli]QBD79162.1 hypothetical protein EPA93_25560 [Ktedonosporobacter rubrisoli]